MPRMVRRAASTPVTMWMKSCSPEAQIEFQTCRFVPYISGIDTVNVPCIFVYSCKPNPSALLSVFGGVTICHKHFLASLPSSPPSWSSMALHHDLGVAWVPWRWMKKWYLLISWWTKLHWNLGFSLILDVACGWEADLKKIEKKWWNRGNSKIGTLPLQVPPCHKRSCSLCPPRQSQPIGLDVDSA